MTLQPPSPDFNNNQATFDPSAGVIPRNASLGPRYEHETMRGKVRVQADTHKSRQAPANDDLAIDIVEKKRQSRLIIKKLSGSELRNVKRVAGRLASCRAYIHSDGDEMKATIRLCNSRWCSVCKQNILSKKRMELLSVVNEARVRFPKSFFSFVTFTQKAYEANSVSVELKRLKGSIARFFKRKLVRQYILGYSYNIEIERSNKFNHIHLHAVVMSSCSSTFLDSIIKANWNAGFIRTRKMDMKSTKVVFECVKYLNKGLTSLSNDFLIEVVNSFFNRRTSAYGFEFKKIKKEMSEMKEKEIEEEEIPEAPSSVSNEGEVLCLPKGKYSISDLLELKRSGNEAAKVALDLLMYRLQYGFRKEREIWSGESET